MTVIVMYQDYEQSDLIGVFTNLDRMRKYMVENKLKPQQHEIYVMYSETEYNTIHERWCEWEDCNIEEDLTYKQHVGNYCKNHIFLAIARKKKQDEEWAENRRLYALRMEEEREARQEKHNKLCDEMGIPRGSNIMRFPYAGETILSGTSYIHPQGEPYVPK